IVVPKADEIDPAQASAVASASFSPSTIQINVVGEVQTPGGVALPPNSTLNQAILAAGGFNTRASDNVNLIRLNPDGTVSRQEIDVNYSAGIDAAGNPILQNNDVIVVGRSGLASVTDTLGAILSPVGSVLSILNLPARILNLFD
ncbi:MAG TPA: SLBB domain-containing protein, partial [Allocoleopsis sp.]